MSQLLLLLLLLCWFMMKLFLKRYFELLIQFSIFRFALITLKLSSVGKYNYEAARNIYVYKHI